MYAYPLGIGGEWWCREEARGIEKGSLVIIQVRDGDEASLGWLQWIRCIQIGFVRNCGFGGGTSELADGRAYAGREDHVQRRAGDSRDFDLHLVDGAVD